MFLDDGAYRIWTGPLHLQDDALLKKRAADLTALSATLSYRGPLTGLALADGPTRERFDALRIGIGLLAGYYLRLAEYPSARKQVGGIGFIAPNTGRGWQEIVYLVSRPVLTSRFAEEWLPSPSLQGHEGQLSPV